MEIDKISVITGREITFCQCDTCKAQCSTPCLGTPQDIEKLIDAGHGDKIFPTSWYVGIMMGIINGPIFMFQAHVNKDTGFCVFNKDGLCTLHDAGLKPTEGKLSHHTITLEDFDPEMCLSWIVAKTWIDPYNLPTILRIADKLNFK
jgi:hypothetical protein